MLSPRIFPAYARQVSERDQHGRNRAQLREDEDELIQDSVGMMVVRSGCRDTRFTGCGGMYAGGVAPVLTVTSTKINNHSSLVFLLRALLGLHNQMLSLFRGNVWREACANPKFKNGAP